MRIASVGHAVLAAAMIAMGLIGLVSGDFAPIWDGVPKDMPGRMLLAFLTSSISLVAGVGLFWRRSAQMSARVLFASLLLWLLIVKGRFVLRAPMQEVTYQDCGITAVMVAGAWVLYAWFARDGDRARPGVTTGERGVRGARVLYGLALIAFGFSHFVYLNLTAPLIPAWLPWHVGLAWFTGGAFLAAGVAVLAGVLARLAATLAAIQIGSFVPLVWLPLLAAGTLSAFQWRELLITCVVCAAAWVVADSYRGVPWLAVNRR